MDQGYPVLQVYHDEEGTWQVLCGTTNDSDDGMVMCLGCVYQKFPLIAQFSNLPKGYDAYRESEADEWEVSITEYDDE